MVAFLAVLMIIPFRGRKRRLIVVTNIVSSNRTWTTTLFVGEVFKKYVDT